MEMKQETTGSSIKIQSWEYGGSKISSPSVVLRNLKEKVAKNFIKLQAIKFQRQKTLRHEQKQLRKAVQHYLNERLQLAKVTEWIFGNGIKDVEAERLNGIKSLIYKFLRFSYEKEDN